MFGLAFIVGTLVPAGILSALFIWGFGRLGFNDTLRLMAATVLALLVATVVGAYGTADGGPPNFEAAFESYVLPQIAWTLVWFFILRGRRLKRQRG